MSSHHDHDSHTSETKPASFGTPLILGLVTVLVIFLLVSTCDKKHCHAESHEKHNVEHHAADHADSHSAH